MSAPTIPNLLALRGARGGRVGRGRGRGRGRGQAGGEGRAALSNEAAIQGTDTDAAVSRLSAVDLGYLEDPYAQYFVQSQGLLPTQRRLPIINRGTYTRTIAIDALIKSFLSEGDATGAPRQIVSLGAGTDTRPFRLFANQNRRGLVYHEIDFQVTSDRKLRAVQAIPRLGNVLPNATPISADGETTNSWSSIPATGGEYYCHGRDLRDLSAESPESIIPGLRTDIPTVIISECCLCYLSPAEASRVLDFFTSRIPDLAIAIYEPIRPDDAFGKMMVSNLAARNIRMQTVDIYRDGPSQDARLRAAGFDVVRHMTIEDIWKSWVKHEERERVDGLEGLDEVEEWKLLAAHYIVAWGARGEAVTAWGATATGGGGESRESDEADEAAG